MALELLHGDTKPKKKTKEKQCRNSIHYHTTYKRNQENKTEDEEEADLRKANKASAQIQISICSVRGE